MTVKTPSSKSPKAAAGASTKTAGKATASSKAVPVTDAELLKMSEKDYMNAAQLEFFRTKLQTLKEDILTVIAAIIDMVVLSCLKDILTIGHIYLISRKQLSLAYSKLRETRFLKESGFLGC